jgi:hypothetical protein
MYTWIKIGTKVSLIKPTIRYIDTPFNTHITYISWNQYVTYSASAFEAVVTETSYLCQDISN